MAKRMNILVMAYQLSPSKGSEYSVAWNYVRHMSKSHDLTVLYGVSGEHMGDCEEMEMYIHDHPIDGVTVIPIYPNRLAKLLNWPNTSGLFPYSFYLAYRVWQRQAYKMACQLIQTHRFDLIHFVGPIGYREPGYLWQLGLPYVWGPISGVNNAPEALYPALSFKARLKFRFRSLVNGYQLRNNKRLSKALHATDVLLTATSENQEVFHELYNKESIQIPENGMVEDASLDRSKFLDVCHYKFISVARIDEGKSIITFLKALTKVRNKECILYQIVGDGPSRADLEAFVKENNLDSCVQFTGKLAREEAVKLFQNAHMHVITSISEGNPTTIWEAMTHGVPTLTLDHCGMKDVVTDQCGIKIPICHYDQVVTDIATAIERLIGAPQLFEQLAEGTLVRAQKYSWTEREKLLSSIYEQVIQKNEK